MGKEKHANNLHNTNSLNAPAQIVTKLTPLSSIHSYPANEGEITINLKLVTHTTIAGILKIKISEKIKSASLQ